MPRGPLSSSLPDETSETNTEDTSNAIQSFMQSQQSSTVVERAVGDSTSVESTACLRKRKSAETDQQKLKRTRPGESFSDDVRLKDTSTGIV